MARIEVHVTPRAARNAAGGFDARGRFRVRLTAPPVDGEANRALVDFLAESLGVPRRRIAILRGESGRVKLIEIADMGDAELRSLLENVTS